DERGQRGQADGGHDRDAQAGDDRRQRERQLDPPEDVAPAQPQAARRLEHLLGHRAEAGEDVPEEDEQRVADERDLDRRHRQPRHRHEQLEEREARDRVQEGADEADRRLQDAVPARGDGGGEGDGEPDGDGDRGQLHVLDERRLQDAPPVVSHPLGAEEVVVRDARARPPEARDVHGAAGGRVDAHEPASRRPTWPTERTPAASPRSSTTTSCSAPSLSISESASRRVVCRPATGAPAARPFGASSSISPSFRSARRLRPRSAPTKRATNSSAGRARTASGVSYWASTPPSRKMAMRSPSLIASSMSCVTKMTVLRSISCSRRNSSCRRSRVIGSRAPNGSSISITGGSAASARARPTRWRWPPDSCAG